MKNIEKHLEIPHRETITGYNTLQTKPFDYQKTENMNNKKQTAVEWLFEQLEEKGDARETPSIRNIQFNLDTSDYLELKRIALEKEKEQIMDAFWNGDNTDCTSEQNSKEFAEQYYNETYKDHK